MAKLLAEQHHIRNERILCAMEKIPRHLFIPEAFRSFADPYGDHPCPIGHGQTISQPYIAAYMTEKLNPQPGDKVLEIGTCAPNEVPLALVEQLAEGGRMMLPVGEGFQRLVLLRKQDGRLIQEEDIPVRFVPMIHRGISGSRFKNAGASGC